MQQNKTRLLLEVAPIILVNDDQVEVVPNGEHVADVSIGGRQVKAS